MEFDSLGIGNEYSAYTTRTAEAPNTNSNQSDAVETQPNKTKETQTAAQTAAKAADKDKEARTFTISEEEIEKTIQTANKKIEPLFLQFHHRIHDKTNRLMISVINTATDELVREIPPEKTLDALAKMWELTGILIDDKG